MLPHETAPLQGWTPVRFFRRDDGQPVVEWCQLGDLRLTAPFFMQTVSAARVRQLPLRQTPADALRDFAETTPDLPVSGLIFHLSRCGSTLVSQSLAALPANVVVSEAEPVEEILASSRWPAPAPDADRLGWLRGLARAFGGRRFPEERRLFFKLDPWHVLDLDSIRAAWPGVPAVFLYRDPVEILVSQGDHLAGSMFADANGPARLGLEAEAAAGMTLEEYCARVLGVLARAAADAAERDPNFRLISYPQLPEAVETVVAPWFRLPLESSETAQIREAARYDAKAPGQWVFRDDSARKQRDADADLRALAGRWIRPEYERLEEIRRSRDG